MVGDSCIMFMDRTAHCNLPFLTHSLMPVYVANPTALNAQFLSARLSYNKILSKLPYVAPKYESCE
jgi:hypothetical protein